MRPGSWPFLLAGACALPALAAAQPAPATAPTPLPSSGGEAQADDETGDIVVTGRAPPGAVIGDIPPENRLGPRDIAAYGVGTVNELLEQLAPQTGSAQGDGGPVILVNGRRISGINEVGDLPTESIIRVDILPEEVALRYGYSAEQKVVNVILRRRFRSLVVNAGGGAATAGGGGTATGDATLTHIRDNDRVNIAARVRTSAALFEDERGITPDATRLFDSVGNVVPLSGDEIDPALSALAGASVTVAGVPAGVAPTLADLAARAGVPNVTDDTRYRTLQPSTRNYSINGVLAHAFAPTITSSFNLRAERSTSRSEQGLATGTLVLPADNPFSPFSQDVGVARVFGASPLTQRDGSTTLHGGTTLNVDLTPKWRVSVIGGYDHAETDTEAERGYDLAAYQAALDAGDPTISPYGPAVPALLGDLLVSEGRSRSDSGNASALVTGPIFHEPAGAVRVSLRAGGTAGSTGARTSGALAVPETSLSRTTGDLFASVDVPIASRSFLSALGTLTANGNLSRTAVSRFGTLEGYGYGLNWTPAKPLALIASVAGSQRAPSLQQLASPTIATANVRFYDFATGATATVTRISGGNPSLRSDDRRQVKLGATYKPFSKLQLTLTANYVDTRVRDAIGAFPGVSESLEEAFPDRFVRDEAGDLVSVDARPVNFARQEQSQLRWGFDFTKILRQPTRPPRPEGGRPRWRDAGGEPRPGGEGGPPPGGAEGGATPPAEGGQGDVVVNGRREESAPPPPPDPFGDRERDRDGFGGRPDGGFGGGPGGPGGGGGRGPGGRGGFGGRGSDNGARLQVTLYHSWIFRNAVQIREGMAEVDLLRDGTLGGAAQPRHRLELNTGVTDNGVGLRLTGQWQSAASVTGGAAPGSEGALRFSSLATFDLRGFVNLQQRLPKAKWARGTRVTLTAANLFNQRQRVTDAQGQTPLAYQPGYLDPLGRTLLLSLRKVF